MKHDIFVSLPSARGVHPFTTWNLFDMRTEAEALGWRLHGSSVYRMPLEFARNELACVYLSTTADLNLLLDDDVQLAPGGLTQMVRAIEAGCDVVSAPCYLRDHSHGGAREGRVFNVYPCGPPEVLSGSAESGAGAVRVIPCEWTGLGAVLVRRSVMERLHADAVAFDAAYSDKINLSDRQTYRSMMQPDRTASTLFRSKVLPASSVLPGAPEGVNVALMDDRVMSLKVRALGMTIHAAIDVATTHDGMSGCMGVEMAREDEARRRAKFGSDAAAPVLVGLDNKPIRRER